MNDDLMNLAREYYRRTEEFDITVCTARAVFSSGPCAVPATPEERKAVALNAAKVKAEIERRCGDLPGLSLAMRQYAASGELARDMEAIHRAAEGRQ